MVEANQHHHKPQRVGETIPICHPLWLQEVFLNYYSCHISCFFYSTSFQPNWSMLTQQITDSESIKRGETASFVASQLVSVFSFINYHATVLFTLRKL